MRDDLRSYPWESDPTVFIEHRETHLRTHTRPKSDLTLVENVKLVHLSRTGGWLLAPLRREGYDEGYDEFGVWPYRRSNDLAILSSQTAITMTETLRNKRPVERLRKQRKAERKALKSLIKHLNVEQKLIFRGSKFSYFYARGQSHTTYKLLREEGVVALRNGYETHYCLHPEKWMPWPDVLFALKLMIEHEEDEFLRRANNCGTRRSRFPFVEDVTVLTPLEKALYLLEKHIVLGDSAPTAAYKLVPGF